MSKIKDLLFELRIMSKNSRILGRGMLSVDNDPKHATIDVSA